MKKINSNDFTWGIEIEGVFSTDFIEDLTYKESLKGRLVEQHADSSVNLNGGEIDCANFDDPSRTRELAIGIFNSHKELLRTLKKFKNENYLWNSSCGIHLHLKPKNEEVRKVFMDYNFIKTLQEIAEKMDERISERINKDGGWCQKYKSLKGTREQMERQEKYKFVRNHPKGTFEFRFFSANRNRERNIAVFVKLMLIELNKVKNVKSKTYFLKAEEKIEIKTTFNDYQNNKIKVICAI